MLRSDTIKKYNTYKDSGIEWIGEIPTTWQKVRLRFLCNIQTGDKDTINKVDDGMYPFYVRSPIVERINTYTFDGEAILTAGDGVGAGKVFHYVTGKFDYHQRVYNLHNFKMIFGKFLYLYLKENFYKEIEKSNAKSTVDSIRLPMLLDFPVVFPVDIVEQQAIANYLDKKCGEIDKVVEAEKSVIEKLKEYKQSVITEAVTKGLDKSVPLKDSGIVWIGKIPQHWETLRIKNVAWLKGRIGWQGLKSDEYQETGAYLITGTDFDNGKINWDTCVHITQERFDEAPEIHIKENDLLITKDGTVGKVALALNCPQDVSLNSGVLLIRNTKDIKYNSKYLYYVLLSNVFWNWFTSNLNGNSTIIHLYQEQFYNFSFAYPTIEEQKQIAEYLDKKCSEIDKAIADKEQLIEKFTEYKKSLIYECVTGKRKVVT